MFRFVEIAGAQSFKYSPNSYEDLKEHKMFVYGLEVDT